MKIRRSPWSVSGVAAIAAFGLTTALTALPVSPAVAVTGAPVINQTFADPDVMQVGNTYYAYATNSNGRHIKWATSTDLNTWTVQSSDALPTLGSWADGNWVFGPDDHGVWAPEVFSTGTNSFVMYYTAHDRASDKQCIGAATATSPGGPFTPRNTTFVCTPETGGVIDASSFRDDDGKRYILWKNDGNCCSQDTWLHIQSVSTDGLTRTGAITQLVKQDKAFEGNLVEAPTMWKHGGRYVLLYSANWFGGDPYATSYATSASLLSGWSKAPAPLMTTDSFGGTVRGPGGQDVVTGPDGKDRIVFHGWDPTYTYRAMYVADLGWDGSLPVVRGSKVKYQAENAALTHAEVRSAPNAGDGRAVGHIDFADSTVTFTVTAPRTGTYRLYTRFGNGSGTTATHQLAVNGVAAGVVTYPQTGWDNWTTVERDVNLNEGRNTITYGKGANYAELDLIEVA